MTRFTFAGFVRLSSQLAAFILSLEPALMQPTAGADLLLDQQRLATALEELTVEMQRVEQERAREAEAERLHGPAPPTHFRSRSNT